MTHDCDALCYPLQGPHIASAAQGVRSRRRICRMEGGRKLLSVPRYELQLAD